MIEYQIGALPCTPFASSRRSPQGETRSMERKNSESYTSGTISVFSPFGGWRHHLFPRKRWHNNPCLLQRRLRREASRCFILPPEQGEVRRSRKGGGERSEPVSRMLIMPYDTESQSRNADFISIAAERQSTTLGPTARQTYEPSEPSGRSPVNPHTEGVSNGALIDRQNDAIS